MCIWRFISKHVIQTIKPLYPHTSHQKIADVFVAQYFLEGFIILWHDDFWRVFFVKFVQGCAKLSKSFSGNNDFKWINQLQMLLFPNVLCCSPYERNCVCAVAKIFMKFLPANNFCQLLLVTRKRSCTSAGNAQAQLHFQDDQQRAFGISNISNWVILIHVLGSIIHQMFTRIRCTVQQFMVGGELFFCHILKWQKLTAI